MSSAARFDSDTIMLVYPAMNSNLQISIAIDLYERSQTHGFEIPRLLFDNLEALEAHIKPSHNKANSMEFNSIYWFLMLPFHFRRCSNGGRNSKNRVAIWRLR